MSSQNPHSESQRDYDHVFNAETIRALRREAHTFARAGVLVGTYVIALVAITEVGPLPVVPSPMKLIATLLATLLFFLGVFFWIMDRDVIVAVFRETVWIGAQRFGLEEKLPPESEYRPVIYESPPRPALAFGRTLQDWGIIVMVPLIPMVYIMDGLSGIGFSLALIIGIGVYIVLGAVMFWFTPVLDTYSVDDAPLRNGRGNE